jgi:hypothetical protein
MRIVTFPGQGVDNAIVAYRDVAERRPVRFRGDDSIGICAELAVRADVRELVTGYREIVAWAQSNATVFNGRSPIILA